MPPAAASPGHVPHGAGEARPQPPGGGSIHSLPPCDAACSSDKPDTLDLPHHCPFALWPGWCPCWATADVLVTGLVTPGSLQWAPGWDFLSLWAFSDVLLPLHVSDLRAAEESTFLNLWGVSESPKGLRLGDVSLTIDSAPGEGPLKPRVSERGTGLPTFSSWSRVEAGSPWPRETTELRGLRLPRCCCRQSCCWAVRPRLPGHCPGTWRVLLTEPLTPHWVCGVPW